MSVTERAEAFLIGRCTFPLTNFLFNRRKILSRYDQLRRSERYGQERLRELQLRRLQRLVAYAYDRIPFYRARFESIGLQAGDIVSLEDLKRIPPLSRQDVIEHRHALVDAACGPSLAKADRSTRGPAEPIPFAPFRRHRLVRNTSSGSTGAPTVFYEDGSRTALNWAHELRLKRWFGVEPGSREARMVRLSTDYLPKSGTIRIRNRLWNQLIVPGVNLTDRDYALAAQKIAAFRPKVLWGFTSALAGLADYVKRSGIDPAPWGLKLAVGWAAPVYDHERSILREVFSCAVSNIYSAREVGHVAGQCPDGSYHANQEYFFVESEECPTGGDPGPGEILVTTLDITPMPFIRYRMGDVGRVAPSKCGCGMTLEVLEDFLGRTGEVFRTRDGRMISPNFWCRTFMNVQLSNAVRRFQVIYESDHAMSIVIVRGANYSDATERMLREHLVKNFSGDMTFKFVYVPEIRPQLSGKYQMVINRMGSGAPA